MYLKISLGMFFSSAILKACICNASFSAKKLLAKHWKSKTLSENSIRFSKDLGVVARFWLRKSFAAVNLKSWLIIRLKIKY